ncbi:Peptidyl-prolyl cis-trans isomerase [uncultured Paludibacter sp.]|nr:Peptidyl-prolyl cis-trans isomerase [uncultured Paludibacter sp.]
MKKQNILFIAMVLAGAFIFSACKPSLKTKTPELKTQLDSLSYAFGLANGQGLKMNAIPGEGDSINKKINAFFAGMEEGLKGKEDKNPELTMTASQFAGWINQQEKVFLGDSTLKFNYDLFKQGVVNGLNKFDKNMTTEKIQEYVNNVMKARYEKKMEEKFGANKTAGEKFLAENAKKTGVMTTASGLQYEVITKGTGAMPKETDKVKVNYEGKLLNDTIFDSSYKRKQPAEFFVNQVIKGWTEGLQLMPVGSKYRFYIPQNLAYGAQEQYKIPPFSMLIFDVELISIEKQPEQPVLQPAPMPSKK